MLLCVSLKGGQGYSHVCLSLQGPAYNRHTLPGDSEPAEQAKEILLLRHKSLLVELSDTCSSRKEVRGSSACSPHSLLIAAGVPSKGKSCCFSSQLKKGLNPKSHSNE